MAGLQRRGQSQWMFAAAVVTALCALAAVHAASFSSSPRDCSAEGNSGVSGARPAAGNLYESCALADGRRGLCLHDYQCHANLTVACGGYLPDSDLRTSDEPLTDCGGFLWCCTYESAATHALTDVSTPTAPDRTPTQSQECRRAFDDCPWCVALYRSGGDPRRRQRTESGLYCGGVLVGARVVLTSATCVRSVGRERVWARVPAAADPAHHYRTTGSLHHRNYSSGSHANDFGLFLLEEDVEWAADAGGAGDARGAGGACVQTPLQGDCFVAGFDVYENLILTPVTVRNGDCRPRRRNVSDAACGLSAAAGSCAAAPGAPVLCPVAVDGQGGQAVAGVVRRNCVGGVVQLGRLQQHERWLREQLALFGVHDAQYTLRT